MKKTRAILFFLIIFSLLINIYIVSAEDEKDSKEKVYILIVGDRILKKNRRTIIIDGERFIGELIPQIEANLKNNAKLEILLNPLKKRECAEIINKIEQVSGLINGTKILDNLIDLLKQNKCVPPDADSFLVVLMNKAFYREEALPTGEKVKKYITGFVRNNHPAVGIVSAVLHDGRPIYDNNLAKAITHEIAHAKISFEHCPNSCLLNSYPYNNDSFCKECLKSLEKKR